MRAHPRPRPTKLAAFANCADDFEATSANRCCMKAATYSALLRGGCVCGAVCYECSGDPIMTFNCHCRDCQHVSGGPYIAVLYFPHESFVLTKGELRHHFTESEAMGRHKRGFCPDCGSRITGGRPNAASASPPRAWTIRASFARSATSTSPTHSRGTTWIRRSRSSITIRRCNPRTRIDGRGAEGFTL